VNPAEENVATILRFHDAMEAADREVLDAMLEEIAHPDCEWAPLVATVEGGYRGKAETRRFFGDFLESFDVRYEDREVEAIGEVGVLVRCTMVLRARESGVPLQQEMGVLYELENGLFRRGRAYPSHAEAEAAAGELKETSRA
jgi:ketosteroid isomerase-like protein